MNVLVTGGAGYIGSHAALRLLDEGHAVTVLDNLATGNRAVLDVLRAAGDFRFVEADAGDAAAVAAVLRRRRVEAVLHFAARTSVGESVREPLPYYRANVGGALGLLEAMAGCSVERLVFSSSAAVYGAPAPSDIPITEDCPAAPVNPYGRTKFVVERMLADLAGRGALACASLRYFNVAGADAAGRLGEDHDPETHLVPVCLEAALGRRPGVTVFGADYDTPDGTCIRDYVHVDDLVGAHVAALCALRPGTCRAYNVGMGHGASVREVLESVRRVTGAEVPAQGGPRRPGDPPVLYADASRIRAELGWTARYTTLDEIVETAWRWKRAHPDGYARASS